MNLNSKRRTDGNTCEQARARPSMHPFKKKRKLFLISQVLLSKYKNSMLPYINIYSALRVRAEHFFLGNGILTIFPFGNWQREKQLCPFHKLFSSALGSTHSFSIDVQKKPFSFFNPKGSLFCICYYKQDL